MHSQTVRDKTLEEAAALIWRHSTRNQRAILQKIYSPCAAAYSLYWEIERVLRKKQKTSELGMCNFALELQLPHKTVVSK